jgi:hypothetical protein
MENRSQKRKIVDIGFCPLPVVAEFILNGEKYFVGKVWDISSTGIGVIVPKNSYEDVSSGMSGTLHIWKIHDKYVDISATCMWVDNSYGIKFYGFQTDVNLYDTELKQYLE